MRILRGIGLALLLLVVFVALIAWFQRKLIYLPATAAPALPSTLRGAVDVSFQASDGTELSAWWVAGRDGQGNQGNQENQGNQGSQEARSQGPQGAQDNSRGTILVFPGNAGHRAGRASLAGAFSRRGFNVLLVDYRGYGGNPGAPSEAGLIADARGARDYVLSRPEVDPARLIYFGESLGTGVAIALAAEHEPAVLVLRSPFTSMTAVGRLHYPWLPVDWLLRDRWDSLGRMATLDCPVMIIAGSADRIVPQELSLQLFEAVTVSQRRWLSLAGETHNSLRLSHGGEMVDGVTSFVAESLTQGP